MDHMHQHPYIKSTHTENWIQKKLCGRVTSPLRIKNWVPKSKPCLCCPWQTPRLCISSSWAWPRSPRAPEKRCRSDARSPPGDSTGHRHRARPRGCAEGHRIPPALGRKTDGFLWRGRFWAPICSCTVHISILGSEVKVKMFLKVTQTVLNTKVRLVWNQEPSLVGCT